jgi:PAS domain S-box-containing protein
MKYSDLKSFINLNTYIAKLGVFLVIVGILYAISLENYLLFRIVISLFNVIIAYMVFIVVWKSKTISENRYLTLIGVAFFFIAGLGFLRSFSYAEMDVFPEYGTNLSVQLWIVMRYLASISFIVAPLLLTGTSVYERKGKEVPKNDNFAQKVFLVYTIVTAVLLLSILKYRNFPDCYVEGSGLTEFKIFSEYIISFLFIGSLVLLYWKRDRFERHVYRLLVVAIIVSIFAELALIYHTNQEDFLNFIGQMFNALSLYFIYIAIVEIGFEEPCSLFFRELKLREEALRRETIFLRDDQGRIYSMLGVDECVSVKPEIEKLQDQRQQDKTRQCNLLTQYIHGIIYFRLNEKRVPVSMDGTVEEITAYSREDFVSGRVKWAEIVVPEDRPLFVENMKMLESNASSSLEMEYRIMRKDGEIRWVQEIIHFITWERGGSRIPRLLSLG